jgi:hypothetical protein
VLLEFAICLPRGELCAFATYLYPVPAVRPNLRVWNDLLNLSKFRELYIFVLFEKHRVAKFVCIALLNASKLVLLFTLH